ncbi:MAG: hypothetical protein HETSPECPRED_003079 [Heterodermia speciosa]|uniref:Uncharacterized protein n=1 Tax=Heterodermia speciosa TaxID=116794 RepID=A0A8H3IKI7_9LECA|nr:MAG: hypothetical protein HETSPECPRED_003079 [Heterodermia speciosa]
MPSSSTDISLPNDLATLALARFDSLLASGKLNYGPSTPTTITHNGFLVTSPFPLPPPPFSHKLTPSPQFSISIPPALSQKPILPPSDPSRSKPGGPFLDPDPDFVLCDVGAKHVLELNKHCILRPMYILHTRAYEKQASDLSRADIQALWALLLHLDPKGEEEAGPGTEQRIMAIYNCGAEAGASQGHKHLQLFPQPAEPSAPRFELYPYQLTLSTETSSEHPTVPYRHAVLALPRDASAEDVYAVYGRLMGEMRPVMEREGVVDYNVVVVREWMLVIPRRHHGREGVECNAVGMMGMVWVRDEEEREGWVRLGMTEHLRWLGIGV